MAKSSAVKQIEEQPPIVFAVCLALCEANGVRNPFVPPFGEVQSGWPIWQDHIGEARHILERVAIMLRAVGHAGAAHHITEQLSEPDQ